MNVDERYVYRETERQNTHPAEGHAWWCDYCTGWSRHRKGEPRGLCIMDAERWGWDARHRAQYRATHRMAP